MQRMETAKTVADTAVSYAAVPPHDEFRNAMVRNGNAVETDMPKARAIHEGRVRTAQLLAANDLVLREMIGEDVTAEKAALRAMDASPQIAAAQTPDALKAVWPDGLPRP